MTDGDGYNPSAPQGAGPSPAAALQELASIPTTVSPELLIIAAGATPADALVVTSAPAHTRLTEAMRGVVRNHVELWTDRELIAYGPATTVGDGQLMWLPASAVPLLDIPEVKQGAADLQGFDPSPSILRHLKLSAMRANTSTGRAIFYRSLSPSQVIGRNKKIPLVRRGNRFDAVSDDTVLLDRDVDAAVVGGIVLFDNRQRFQRVFDFLEQTRQHAGQTFDAITADLRIKNFDEFRAAATGQLQMLGKLASIEQKLQDYPAYKDALKMDSLVAFVQDNPYTGVKVEGAGDDAELVFEPDAQHRFKILKLLDDDYLQSALTELAYEANSKGLPL